jgi:(p)ppGpp synthase/HD superfamily hydrolase
MELTRRQQLLFDFIIKKHGDQKRKYSGEPYYLHLYEVANIVSSHVLQRECEFYNLIEIALGHDILEDTDCSINELFSVLVQLGYTDSDASSITEGIQDLTDVYTSESFASLNRSMRKSLEADRLSHVCYSAQTVKYADLMSNTKSIVQFDPSFAKIYLREKNLILSKMDKGHKALHWLAIHCWVEAMSKLEPKPMTEEEYREQDKLWAELFNIVNDTPGAAVPLDKLRHTFKLIKPWQK